MVFGARVYPNLQPSPILKQRLLAAAAMNQGPVDFFISGTGNANSEVKIMAQELAALGVPANRMKLDNYGIDTGDTCRHGAQQHIKKGIVVTQFFHLTRALWICELNGIEVIGIDASEISLGPPLGGPGIFATVWIRAKRHAREAGLVWLQLVGLYDLISNEAPY